MIYVDSFYLAVMKEMADGDWHTIEAVEKSLLLKGYSLHETCRVGAILEAEVDDPEARDDIEARRNRRAEYNAVKVNGRLVAVYRLNAAGLARLKQLAPAKPPEPKKQQKGLFA